MDAAARARSSMIIEWSDDLLVVRLDKPGGSRLGSLALAAAGLVLAPVLTAILARMLVPQLPAAPLVAAGFLFGLLFALTAVSNRRIVARRGSEGVFLERHSILRHRKSRRLLAPFATLESWAIESYSDEEGTSHALVLVCDRRRIPVLSGDPEMLGEAGALIATMAATAPAPAG